MSVRVMSWVWDHAHASGVELLVLLAIADHASDDGANAWPSTTTLARKCRVSERTVQRVVQKLAAEHVGALEVDWNAGPGGTNRFRVVMHPPSDCHPRQVDAPDTGVTTPPTTVSGEPSLNRPIPPNPPQAGGAATACKDHKRPRRGCAACATPAPYVPPWCGGCDPSTRLAELPDGRVARCATCHPLTGAQPPPPDDRDPDPRERQTPRSDR